MANWVTDFLERNPELAGLPVQRHRHALSFRRGAERLSFFVGSPAHWWDAAEGWREIDTTLRRMPDGGWAAPGLPVRVYADGTTFCEGYAQRTGRVGVLSAARFYPLAELGPGRVAGDCLIREARGFRHVVQVTERGMREELHVERDVSGAEGDLLTVETQSRGRLLVGYRFGRPVGLVDGTSLTLTRRGGWAGLPLTLARTGAVLDPDYAADSADGMLSGTNATYATARSTSSDYNSTATSVWVGQATGYNVYRGFLKFDTSGIPDTDVVSQVNLKLVSTADTSTTDFDVQIVKQDWSGQDPLSDANRETAFDGCLSGTADSAIWRNTSGMSVNTVYTSGNLATDWPVLTGPTYYSLRSSRDYANTQPSGDEYIRIASQNNATAGYRPLLAVVHANVGQPMLTRGPLLHSALLQGRLAR